MAFVIDITEVVRTLDIPKNRVNAVTQKAVEQATWEAYNQIHVMASRELRKTRRVFKDNIQFPEFERSGYGIRGSITLTGALPNMIEQGAAPFDMKVGFGRSAKKKMKKGGGWYLSIPFRHATPGSIGDNPAFSSVMSSGVYEQMKQKITTVSSPFFGTIRQGGSLTVNDLYKAGVRGTGRRAAIPKANMGDLTKEQAAPYQHKSHIHAGMKRMQTMYGTAEQSTYMTFRRVSDLSPANSWIHRGFTAADIMPRALNHPNVKGAIAQAIDSELAVMGR